MPSERDPVSVPDRPSTSRRWGVLLVMSAMLIVIGVTSGKGELRELNLLMTALPAGFCVWLVLGRREAPRSAARAEVRQIPGTAGEWGLLFPTSRTVAVRICVICLGLMLAESAMALQAPHQPGKEVVGVLTVLMFGVGFAVMVPSVVRAGGLALTPQRIVYWSGLGRFSARWDDLQAVGIIKDVAARPTVALHATDSRTLGLRGWIRLLAPLQRRSCGMDVCIPLQTLQGHPDHVEYAVTHFRDHPTERARLADPTVLDLDAFRPTR